MRYRLFLPAPVLFAFLFIVYLFSLAPSIYAGDSSLFAAAAFSLSTAHPPGYPLFMMIGKILAFLPFGNVACRVNLVSALFGALTCVMVYKAAWDVTGSTAASWASAALCGLTPLFFGESVKAEVYTLNSFLSACVFYLGLRMLQSDERIDRFRYALLGSFIVGLGIGNHHTIAFMGIAFTFPLLLVWRLFPFRLPVFASMAFLSGFSVNLYLYLRSIATYKAGNLMAYSVVFDWETFFNVLFRRQYSGSSLTALASTSHNVLGWFYGLKNAFGTVILENGAIFIPFAIIGIIVLFRKSPRIGIYLLGSLLIWLVLLGKMTMASPIVNRQHLQTVSVYFIPVLGVYYTTVAAGFSGLLQWLEKRELYLLRKVIPVSIVLVPLLLLPYSYSIRNQAQHYLVYDFAKDRMTVLPPKSLLVNYSDNPIFITFYMKAVERYREDILTMNTKRGKEVKRFGLHSSPLYKYAEMYPEFFEQEKSTFAELNREFVSRHALFTSNPIELEDEFSRHLKTAPSVLSTAVYAEEESPEQIRNIVLERFRNTYDKINYERVIGLPTSYDFVDQEMANTYAFTTLVYGSLLKQYGNAEAGNNLYRNAFLMSPPEGFLGPFIHYLVKSGQYDEASLLLNDLKETSLAGMAGTLRKEFLSDTKIEPSGKK